MDNKLDLSCFESTFNNDDSGRPAYNLAILLKIILFAYSKGITSSRKIEWCYRTNILFIALTCQNAPHFTTITHFICGYPESIEALFKQVLLVCDEQGLLDNKLLAIDCCKLPSNAGKTWPVTHKEFSDKRKKLKHLIHHHMALHQRLNKLETDESEPAARLQQSITTLGKATDKIGTFFSANKPREGKGKRKTEVKSNIMDNEITKMTTSKGTT